MSCNYAESLSYYENKGKLGLPEKFEGRESVEEKCEILAEYIKCSKHTVVHTGAGVSTSAGIPDFRGPNGVWTLEKEGKKPSINVEWDAARPTLTHMAIFSLYKAGYISYIVTQNIDGLHLRSGIPRRCLASLHGNLFVDKCGKCQKQFVRENATRTVGQKTENVACPGRYVNGRQCRGKLFDTILDWEDALPVSDLELSHVHSCAADLSLCLGSSLQMLPSCNLPVHTKKRGGKLVICNLQPTKQDRHADMIINTYVDDVLVRVLELLKVPLLEYDETNDPVCITRSQLNGLRLAKGKESLDQKYPDDFQPIVWTVDEAWLKDRSLIDKSKRKIISKRPKKENQVNECSENQNGLKRLKNGDATENNVSEVVQN